MGNGSKYLNEIGEQLFPDIFIGYALIAMDVHSCCEKKTTMVNQQSLFIFKGILT
ncbi:MAG: hypothetical protein FD159_1992 [Syntrophaceae bacterium]|nr:MAG: hypothetical protein FD159_1992 [Syntrophaceae bacterium]